MAYTKMFSEELWEKVSDENKELLDDYILELESTGKSEKTIYQYQADIKGFMTWTVSHGGKDSILDMKKRDFRNFFLKMSKEGVSNARINRLQSSLRNLLLFAENDEDLYEDYEINQMRSIKGVPKESVREIVFLEDKEVTGLIDYLMEREQYQKALYVSLSYDSAGRRNEVHQVLKTDFLESNQTNTLVGKRGKKFNLIYFNRTKEIAAKYLEQRGDDDIESLWVTGRGESKRPASYESLYNFAVSFRPIIKELFDKDIDLNSHSFRHSSLENYSNGTHSVLREMGKDALPIDVLKVVAHHSDISTTQSYLKNKDDELLADAFGF